MAGIDVQGVEETFPRFIQMPLCFKGNTLIVVHVRQDAVNALPLSKDIRRIFNSALIEKSIPQLKVGIGVCRVGFDDSSIEWFHMGNISALSELPGLSK